MQMEKLKFYLTAIVVFTQVASAAGRVYTDGNVARFRCTPRSPVQPPDTYNLTTGGVTVKFPLTHIFCGEIHGMKATGFHSTAAPQSDARIPSAKRLPRQPKGAEIYNATRREYIPVDYKTFFDSSLTVKGLSNCISKWAAECYNNNINYSGDCMHLTNIPNVNNGIRVFFRSSRGWQGHVITLKTAYPPDNPIQGCITCQFPQTLSTCYLRQ